MTESIKTKSLTLSYGDTNIIENLDLFFLLLYSNE